MQKTNCKVLILLGLYSFLLLSRMPGLLADTTVDASVDKQTVQQNEEINLTIKVSNSKGNIPAPHLPNFSAFNSFYSGRASQFTFINGQSQSTVAFNYVLVPKASGVFTIDPIVVDIDGSKYKTQPIQVEVLGQSSPSAGAQPSRQPSGAPISNRPPLPSTSPSVPPMVSQAADENIFLRANPSKRMLYSNEQLLLTYSLLTRYDTRYEGFEQEPQASGFWTEEFPLERELPKQTEVINGRKYVRADIKKLALFPTAPGEYTIKPGSVKASVQIDQAPSSFLDDFFNDSFFSNSGVFARRVDKVLETDPISIVVRPLPEDGKPSGFNGAVGDFRMTASVDRREIKQNEPATLQLVIEGEGNIETLPRPPVPELPDVKSYDSNAKTEFFKAESTIAGKKTFEVIFIPKMAGNLEIPPIEFSFFNPKSERYVTLKSPSFQIKVNPSLNSEPVIPKELQDIQLNTKKEVTSVERDIQYIHEKINPKSENSNRLMWFLIFTNSVLSVLAVVLVLRKKQDEFFDANVALRRNRFAKRKAKQFYKKIIQLSKKENPKDQQLFFDEAEHLMNQYLADKLNVSPQGITHQMIFDALRARGISEDVIQKVKKFYDTCGYVKYGAGEFQEKTQEILEAVETVLKENI